MKQFSDKVRNFFKNEKYSGLIQFIKFGIVGVSNTAISYGIDLLCYYILLKNVQWQENTKIVLTSALAFIISVTNSYFWNNRYVFKEQKRKTIKEHLIAYFKTIICYAFTGLLLSPIIKLLLNRTGLQYWLASVSSLIVSVPLNFIMNKFWTYRGRS